MTDKKLNPSFEDLNKVETFKEHLNEVIPKSKFISAYELLKKEIDSIPTLVAPFFPKSGLVAVAGSSDTGKSSFLRQLAVSVCVGDTNFLGFEMNAEYKSAIYVSTEDDENAIAYLLQKSNKARKLKHSDYTGLAYVFDTYNLLQTLEEQLQKSKADLVVIDAFTDLYGKSMNDTNQVRTFLNDFSQLAQKYKCLVIFLHHTGKRTDDLEPSKHNLLGSQGFEAKMRLVIELRRDLINPTHIHLCIVKGNYLSNECKTESYVLQFDENLQFSNTGERRLFDELRKGNKTNTSEKIRQLSNSGKNQTEIAKELNVSQPTVSRYLKN